MDTDSPQGPTNRQVLLGLFVVGQLLFLVAANLIGMADRARLYLKEEPTDDARETFGGRFRHWSQAVVDHVAPGWTHEEGHVHDALLMTNATLARWSQATGQTQDWSLFAPGIYTITTFVAVQPCWDDGRLLPSRLALIASSDPLRAVTLAATVRSLEADRPPPVLLLSENEPNDLRSFFRLGKFRLRRYESNLDLAMSCQDDKVDERRVDGWRQQIEDKVRADWRCLRAYLRWRLAAFRRSRPDLPPPTQVILLVRVYRIPAPDEPRPPGFWSRPDQRPLARWLPNVPEAEGFLPIEMYNPVTGRYERLKAKPGEL